MRKVFLAFLLLSVTLLSAQEEKPLVTFVTPTPELTGKLNKVKKDREFIEELLTKSNADSANWSESDKKELKKAEERNINDLKVLCFDDKMQEAHDLLKKWYPIDLIEIEYNIRSTAIKKEYKEKMSHIKSPEEILEEGLKNLMTPEEFFEAQKHKKSEMKREQNGQGLNNSAILLKESSNEKLNAIYQDIKNAAEDKWGSNYSMILYTINQQGNAFSDVMTAPKRPDYDESIMTEAINKWCSKEDNKIKCDWVMVMYEYNKQLKAKSAY